MANKDSKVTAIKRFLCHCSYMELVELDKYIDKRKKEVYELEAKKKADEAWEDFKKVQPGDLIWNISSGMALYRTWQRGDCGIVYVIQPKKKIIWLDTEYGWVALRPSRLVDSVSFSLPVSSISEEDRHKAEMMGKVIEETLKEI